MFTLFFLTKISSLKICLSFCIIEKMRDHIYQLKGWDNLETYGERQTWKWKTNVYTVCFFSFWEYLDCVSYSYWGCTIRARIDAPMCIFSIDFLKFEIKSRTRWKLDVSGEINRVQSVHLYKQTNEINECLPMRQFIPGNLSCADKRNIYFFFFSFFDNANNLFIRSKYFLCYLSL